MMSESHCILNLTHTTVEGGNNINQFLKTSRFFLSLLDAMIIKIPKCKHDGKTHQRPK